MAKALAGAGWCSEGIGCRCDACAPARSRRYAAARVVGLDKRIRDRIATCGVNEIPLACGCGPMVAVERCRQRWFCEVCQKLWSLRLTRAIADGLRGALRAELDGWAADGARGTRPSIRLLTLTTRHSGHLRRDRERIALLWRRLYKRMHRKWGRFPFVLVWEVTPGDDGKGHVHAHVAAVWRYRDYRAIHRMVRSIDRGSHIDIRPPRRDGRDTNGSSAAKYLGKYLSKSVQGDDFTPTLRAEVAIAFYNAHGVEVSSGFWRVHVHRCSRCKELVKRVRVCSPELFDTLRAHGAPMYYLRRAWDPLESEPQESLEGICARLEAASGIPHVIVTGAC